MSDVLYHLHTLIQLLGDNHAREPETQVNLNGDNNNVDEDADHFWGRDGNLETLGKFTIL